MTPRNLLAPSIHSVAQSLPDVLHVGRNIVLGSDQKFHNAGCILCSAEVEGRATGSVRVFAGNVFLNGTVDGNILVFGGNLTLTGQAAVGGRVLVFGGRLHQDSAAAIQNHTVLPPIIFLPMILLICVVIGSLIVLTRRMVRGPITYPPLPRL
jgi:hypothetical protein